MERGKWRERNVWRGREGVGTLAWYRLNIICSPKHVDLILLVSVQTHMYCQCLYKQK